MRTSHLLRNASHSGALLRFLLDFLMSVVFGPLGGVDIEFGFHSSYVPPESTAQGRNRCSQCPCRLFPRIAGVAQGKDRAASFAKHPNNLLELQVRMNLTCPNPIDGPAGQFFCAAESFEPPQLAYVSMESPLECAHKETMDLL